MRFKNKRVFSILLALYLLVGIQVSIFARDEQTAEDAASLGMSGVRLLINNGQTFEERRSEIAEKWNQRKPVFSGTDYYDIAPSVSAPYAAGKLKDAYLQDAINALNFSRFLAGLPDDVIMDDSYTSFSQHGAVLLSASQFGHSPPKPGNMPDDFYTIAHKGTYSGNIASGNRTLADTVFRGWMADSSSAGNLSSVGHRRWILNPSMKKTGFGQVPGYGVMYAFDDSRTETVDYQAICYPGGAAFPNDMFQGDYPWSLTVNPAHFRTPDANDVTVTLTQADGGRTWNFSKGGSDHFTVNNSPYGVANCIIFRPSGISGYSGKYTVAVGGIKDRAGNATTLYYEVTFYSLGGRWDPGDGGTGGDTGGDDTGGGNIGGNGTGGGSTGGGGSSGGSSSGNTSSSVGIPGSGASGNGRSSNVSANGSVQGASVLAEAKKKWAAAADSAVVTTKNATHLSPSTIASLAKASAKAGKSLTLYADTLTADNKNVQGRLYVEPAKLTGLTADLRLGIYIEGNQVDSAKALFAKYYGNQVAVIRCEQQGTLGARLQIAAKVDLSGMDAQNLYFYSYDAASNDYIRISNPEYFTDQQGYLHLYTEYAGYLIVADSPLEKK